MNRIRAAIAVLNQTPFAWDENRTNIEAAITEARRRGVTLLCLPELCITGYGCEDMFLASFVQDEAFRILERLAPLTRGMIVSFGLPVLHRGCVYNTAAMVVDGEIAGFVAKQFLAGDGIHYEPRWFKPWPTGRRATLEHGEQRYPIGDLTFDIGGMVLGFEICEDAWVARRPGASLSLQGVDVILNPSASHFAFGKQRIRRRLVLEGSRAFGVSYLYANLLGNEAGRAVYDGGGMIAAAGNLLVETKPFSYAGMGVYDAVLDIDHTRLIRAQSASFRPEVEGDERCVRVSFDHNDVAPKRVDIKPEPWIEGPHRKEEEFTRAIGLALLDYMRKSRSQGFVVSLSGGADSAACCVLIYTALRMAAAELGWDGLQKRLAHVKRHRQHGQREGAHAQGADHRLPGHAQQRRRHPQRRARHGRGGLRRPLRAGRGRAGEGLRGHGRRRRGAPADLGARRPHAPEHPGTHARAGHLDVRQPALAAAAGHQQPLRGRGGLLHHGRRHLRRRLAHRGHRQGVLAAVAALHGEHRAARAHAHAGAGAHQPPAAHRRAAPQGERADRRGRPDALPAAGRHRDGGHPRQEGPG
jgi:predicted amidohydrolase